MRIYLFLAVMWGLMILGGGLAVTMLGPLQFGPEPHQTVAASAAKALAAVLMVALWIVILVKLKVYVFRN